ncbi:hypothetical protein [Streptomyces sp. Rer75]|uniref:hypothetical protein n=1 Tax=unclassified Streptomyces TaxID=2593676 RepID=UPI0015CFB789|nr:hypothetical protein [Streptomyces sp. Rer75]QLH21914.1 hypothetical protein HYQ63_15905 [Streptomyces sp. Rer75]
MYSPIPELNLLKEFDDSVKDWYAPGFELREFGKDSGYPKAADRLRTFALATRSGSDYAIWLLDDRTDLATLPIVFLGDEGGINLVARNMREFFRVLASGWTPCGDWESVAYDNDREEDEEEDYDPCPDNAKFREWLRHHFSLEAVEDPNDIVEATESQLWDRFAEWIGPLYPDVVSSRTTA